jgi:hypothetical protein
VILESSDLMKSVALQNATELGSALAGTDVHAVLCGHFHLQLTGTLAGVTVWVTPGVVIRIDLTTPNHLERAVKGASATVVDLGGPFSPTFHVVHARDPQAGTQVYLVDAMSGDRCRARRDNLVSRDQLTTRHPGTSTTARRVSTAESPSRDRRPAA